MTEAYPQINKFADGTTTFGDYPDAAIQTALNKQDERYNLAEANFQTAVDNYNLNEAYAEELSAVQNYFAEKGLEVAPVRVVSREVMEAAYAAAGESSDVHQEGHEGRHVHGRAMIIENADIADLFGSNFIVGMALHEEAHSLGKDRQVRKVTVENNRITPKNYRFSGVGKADLREATESSIVGEFWEEAFADLTRVRALRDLRHSNELAGDSKPVEIVNGMKVVVTPNGNTRKDPDILQMPAEFAMLTKSIDGKNIVATAAPNYAAYALDQLDNRMPGLYEDFLAATKDPARQADAIRKIESVQPGLYRALRDLEYSTEDFVRGLQMVKVALAKTENTPEKGQAIEFLTPAQMEAAKAALRGVRVSMSRSDPPHVTERNDQS